MERRPDGELDYFQVRSDIREAGRQEGVAVWTAEKEGVGPELGWPDAMKACVEALVKSDLLLVVLASRSGRPVELAGLGSTVSSILEVELFHASNWRVPTIFIQATNYLQEPELKNLVRVLRLRDNANWLLVEETAIVPTVRELFRTLRKGGLSISVPAAVPDKLALRRGQAKAVAEVESTSLSLVGRFRPTVGEFGASRFAELLRLSDLQQHGGNRYVQLSLLWMAMRELSAGDATEWDRRGFWQELAKRWSTASAWLGLHGYVNAGVMAALHTQAAVRVRDGSRDFGAYASELFSIGRLVQTAECRRRIFQQVAELSTIQAKSTPGDQSSSLLIRASAKMQLALLGRPWLALDGLSDYRRAYDMRVRMAAPIEAQGEALVELAYAQFQMADRVGWKLNGALTRMREGVQMQEDGPIERAGFLLRSTRKLSESLGQAGFGDEAEFHIGRAIGLARNLGHSDQLRQLERQRDLLATRATRIAP